MEGDLSSDESDKEWLFILVDELDGSSDDE
jgi:hypothetical protein